ncbi:DUF2786 domain-containing protein [Actinomadura sp. 21ATH]|uniref:DUF2786 domain-containing protein n=1 Tax=Actinomadura sp. 21ATH TaxID=1735444 RepID=UPI0035C03DEB
MGATRWWNRKTRDAAPPENPPGNPPGDPPEEPPSRDGLLVARLQRAITVAWGRGWQPADLVRHTARRLSPRHERLVVDAIAAETRGYATLGPQWRAQLTAIDARIWWDGDYAGAWCAAEEAGPDALAACATELLDLLLALPRLATIGPPPGAAVPDTPPAEIDQRMLGKVRALLAKAESTEFPEEAEALSARAQELMARHSIDHALLDADLGTVSEPAGRRLAVDTPYDGPKAALLTVVADANRCRAIWHRELGFSTVLGFPADLAAVELLFTSLLVQATTAMVNAGPRRDAAGRSRTRSFRHAFLNAYAARVGERLREAAGRAASESESGGRDLVPVLAARDQAVDDAVEALFPNLSRGRARTVSNHEGWAAGRAAADLASLNARSEVSGR